MGSSVCKQEYTSVTKEEPIASIQSSDTGEGGRIIDCIIQPIRELARSIACGEGGAAERTDGPPFMRTYELRDPKSLEHLITEYGKRSENGRSGYFECTKLEASLTRKHIPATSDCIDLHERIVVEFEVVNELTNPDPLYPTGKPATNLHIMVTFIHMRGRPYTTSIQLKREGSDEVYLTAESQCNETWIGISDKRAQETLRYTVLEQMGEHAEEVMRCLGAMHLGLLSIWNR